MSRLAYLATFFLLGAWSLPAAFADEQCEISHFETTSNRLGRLDFIFNQGCLGGDRDDSSLTKAILKDLKKIQDDARTLEELTAQRDQLLALLTRIEGSLSNSTPDQGGTWRGYFGIALNELDKAKTEIQDFESIVRAQWWLRHQDHGFFESEATGAFLVAYGDDLGQACPDSTFDAACRSAIESAMELTRHVNLVFQVLQNPVRGHLKQLHSAVAELDEEWDYYFYEARSQYWWEFLVNGSRYDPKCQQDDPNCVVVDPNREFLARPPDGQLIVFHPRVAAEFVSGEGAANSTNNLAAIVELIGYNRLRWKSGAPYSKWPLGASLVASWVPAAEGDDYGYGLMIHVKNNYSIGAVRRDTGHGDETTWMLSVDLNKLFLEKSAQAQKLFRFGN